MNAAAHKILREALQLPDSERAALAASLMESLDPHFDQDVEDAWKEELSRRLAELDEGSVRAIPWPEARRLIRGSSDASPGD